MDAQKITQQYEKACKRVATLEDKAVTLGQRARLADKSKSDNPFDEPVLQQQWEEGWMYQDMRFRLNATRRANSTRRQ